MDKDLKFILLGGALFAFVVLYFVYQDNVNVTESAVRCEAKGGTLLEHTYKVGKFSHNEHICIDSKVIIDY